jgi:solute:Na+ symporter, SSS family
MPSDYRSTLSTLDVIVLTAYLLVTLLLGLVSRRADADTAEYFLAKRQLPWWALLLSIVATETSMVTFLSVPGKAFVTPGGDLRLLQVALGYIIGRVVAAYLLLPHYFRGSLLTAYGLLDARAGRGTRWLASLLFLVSRTIGDALRLYLTAIVLNQVVHWDITACVVLIGIVTGIYTIAGGLRSVVWNDCVQFIIYLIGAIWAFVLLIKKIPGGIHEIGQYAAANGKLEWVVWEWGWTGNDYVLGVSIVGGALLSLASHGTDQMIVQRLLGARTEAEAKRSLIGSGLVVAAQFALFLAIGLGLGCFYNLNPPAGGLPRPDAAFSTFLVDHLPSGILGIVLAALLAAAMSTQSSSLNASSSALVNDFLRPRFATMADERRLLAWGKWSTGIFCFLQMAIAIGCNQWVRQRSIIDEVLGIAAFTNGPILGLFLLCLAWKDVRPISTFVAFGIGLVMVSSVRFTTDVAPLWFTGIGAMVVLFVGSMWQIVLAKKANSE